MTTAIQPKFAGNEPDQTDLLTLHKLDVFSSLNCVRVGQIQSFDPTKLTAVVQILGVRIMPDGTTQSYRPLLDVPLVTLQGGGAYISLPVQAGDQGLLFFADRNIDAWFNSGSAQPPLDARMHDLSDGFMLVGVNALSNQIVSYIADQLTISYDGAKVALSGGLVTIANLTTTLLTLINGFITLLEAAQVQGPGASVYPFTAAFIALLDAYKAQFAELLT